MPTTGKTKKTRSLNTVRRSAPGGVPLKLIGLMGLWAAMSLALLPFLPFAAPELLRWFGAPAAASLDPA